MSLSFNSKSSVINSNLTKLEDKELDFLLTLFPLFFPSFSWISPLSQSSKRVLESQIRSMSNLLERLHHSQFFYFLATPNTFIQIGLALPCALLLSAALTIQGLKRWSKEGKFSSMRRSEIFKRTRIEVEALQQSTFKSSIRSPRDLSLENPSVDQLVDCLLDEISNESLQSDQSLFFKIKQTCQKFKRQVDQTNRPVGQALAIMTACCIFGLAISMLLKRENCDSLVAEIPVSAKIKLLRIETIKHSRLCNREGNPLLIVVSCPIFGFVLSFFTATQKVEHLDCRFDHLEWYHFEFWCFSSTFFGSIFKTVSGFNLTLIQSSLFWNRHPLHFTVESSSGLRFGNHGRSTPPILWSKSFDLFSKVFIYAIST